MFYILVIAPMDQVFVGPFYQRAAAQDHAHAIRAKAQANGSCHETTIMSAAERDENESEFGPLPLQSE